MNESDLEKYSPDFIVNCSSKSKKNSCYEYIYFETGGHISYKLSSYYSMDKGTDKINENILSWIKAKKYENILFAVEKTYYIFSLNIKNESALQLIKEKIANVVNDKEKEIKMIILIVNCNNSEISNTVSAYFTNNNEYNSCENDKK